MKNILLFLAFIVFLSACKSNKTVSVSSGNKTTSAVKYSASATNDFHGTNGSGYSEKTTDKNTDRIIKTALSYSGTKYKYGGTTKKGMDCSGLIYTSFTSNDISLHRSSSMMATQGKKIRLNDVQKGDLLFFRTDNKRGKINHVGLIVDINGDDVKFIHSTTSRGVIVSSIKEGYWNHAFVEARRVL